MNACTANEMRNIDRLASERGGVPSIILMENAALACVNALYSKFPDMRSKRAAVFCGKGNNGGDGFAIARHLYNRAVDTTVFLVCGDEFKGDAQINFDIIDGMNVKIEHVYNTDILDYVIPSYDIVIDAIFGTGIHGEIEGTPRDVIEKINEFSKFTLSADVPSGINSDTGEVCGVCVRADMTVTFAAYKIGMLLYPAADFTGEIILDKISIPDYIINSAPHAAEVMDDKMYAGLFPPRRSDSHKGDYGKILVVGGSEGMSGAPYMAATAALNAGAGLVTIAAPDCINDILEVKTTEIMTAAVKSRGGRFAAEGAYEILKRAEKSDAVLIGPGMGTSEECAEIVRELLKNAKQPVVVDADALNILSRDMTMLEDCTCPLIFTPHEMEFSRLSGLAPDEIKADRLGTSKAFCEKYGVTLVLKGAHTVVTAPDGFQYINNTGGPGLAKGGSGDVLAGITAAFAARLGDETLSAAAAVYLHGKSGDAVTEQRGAEAVTASAVADGLGRAADIICRSVYYR